MKARKVMIEFLVKVNEKMFKGPVFTGGSLKGTNIRVYFNSLSNEELHAEYRIYGC